MTTMSAECTALASQSGPECADTVILVLSELVTNALRHGGGAYALSCPVGPADRREPAGG
ncbi:hypothetical protein M8Z33_25840 [Streptomyces sp. ZAF1911]|uniref:hypothetical protein n=1 Tax=unclassified Streptomyces TaxID=2593676 RepID=UPI00237AEE87|nr:hypothetical protein [Streptomyces sp. ZAF1911]MDD9380018.1 hypothetical protein [Streptomyces sp. ZAF1911]